MKAAVRLFNEGQFLASHELFEELWEASHGPSSDCFKGLIQAAIALHHFQDGKLDGARKLYAGHRRYLAAYLPNHRGLDLAGFLDEMQSTFRPLMRAAPDAPVAFERGPTLHFVPEEAQPS